MIRADTALFADSFPQYSTGNHVMMATMLPPAPPACRQFPLAARGILALAVLTLGLSAPSPVAAAEAQAAAAHTVPSYEKDVLPILENYCFDCHADGLNKGNVAFDAPANDALLKNHDLWLKVIKNVRAGIMPPAKKDRPNPDELRTLEKWVKYGAFGIDPANPDP